MGMTVEQDTRTSETIVVGLDGSPSARAAMAWAARRARSTAARLRAIHVLERPEARALYAMPVITSRILSADELDPSWTDACRRDFAASGPEQSWTLEFAEGGPGPAMSEASQGAVLLVLGTREHRGFGRLVSGSVSHYCVNHAGCPVVAVPMMADDVLAASATAAPARG